MQPMTKFMEQGDHFRVCQQRRLAGIVADRRRHEVAHQIGHWQKAALSKLHATDTVIHPCATALLGARIQVDIEAAATRTIAVHYVEELHIVVILLHIPAFYNLHAIQA